MCARWRKRCAPDILSVSSLTVGGSWRWNLKKNVFVKQNVFVFCSTFHVTHCVAQLHPKPLTMLWGEFEWPLEEAVHWTHPNPTVIVILVVIMAGGKKNQSTNIRVICAFQSSFIPFHIKTFEQYLIIFLIVKYLGFVVYLQSIFLFIITFSFSVTAEPIPADERHEVLLKTLWEI